MVFDNRNFYPIQQKQPTEMTPEWKFINGVIEGIAYVILSQGLQYLVEKLSNLYSEWQIKFQLWLRNNWNW